jgi:hypothetical protein
MTTGALSVGAEEASVSDPNPAGAEDNWNTMRSVRAVLPGVLLVSCTVEPGSGL